MIYEVINDFKDIECDKELRTQGMLLDFEDKERAEELIVKGLIKTRKVTTIPGVEIPAPEKKTTKKNAKNKEVEVGEVENKEGV